MREPKPPLVNQQCVVYNYQCDLCDAEYVGYTSRHLHQRIDEHRFSAIGKHLKNDHGIKAIGDLNSNFSVLKKCGGKTGLFNLRNVVYKEEETKAEHAIGLYPRKTIYLDILTMHAQLHAKYITYCLFF